MIKCNREDASREISRTIAMAPGEIILVLLSGGSSAQIGVRALASLSGVDQRRVVVTLADERLVGYDSEDSNAKLLKDYGLKRYCNRFIEVLEPGVPDASLVERYVGTLETYLSLADSIVAVLGVGEDNHTAGILPETEAAVSDKPYAVAYKTSRFNRATIAPNFFKKITHAFVYAEGESKEPAISSIEQEHDNVAYPTQNIKKCKRWTLLYNKEGR